MAGGIFVEQPFHLNPKCVVFAAILILGYWVLPAKQPILIPFIFITAYIAMAWYDFMYNCDQQLFSGISPIGSATFDAWGKPQRRWTRPSIPTTGAVLVEDQEAAYKRNINRFHVFGVMPFFVIAAYFGIQAFKKRKEMQLNVGLRAALWIAAAWVLLYHGTRFFFMPRQTSENPEIQASETANLRAVNFIHIVGVAPVLMYCAWYGAEANEFAWYTLGTLGVIAGAYHAFRLWFPRNIQKKKIQVFSFKSPEISF